MYTLVTSPNKVYTQAPCLRPPTPTPWDRYAQHSSGCCEKGVVWGSRAKRRRATTGQEHTLGLSLRRKKGVQNLTRYVRKKEYLLELKVIFGAPSGRTIRGKHWGLFFTLACSPSMLLCVQVCWCLNDGEGTQRQDGPLSTAAACRWLSGLKAEFMGVENGGGNPALKPSPAPTYWHIHGCHSGKTDSLAPDFVFFPCDPSGRRCFCEETPRSD